MKLYKSLFLTAVAAMAFTSCSDEGYWEKYEMTETQYSFDQSKQSFSLAATDALPSVTVALSRSTNVGETKLPLIVEFDNAIMSVADTNVVFADGSYTAELVVNIDEANIVMGTAYNANITFVLDSINFFEHNYSISGNKSHSISVIKDYTWVAAGKGIYASSWTGEQFAVSFEKAEEYADEAGRGYYRFAPYKAGYYIPFYVDASGNASECPAGSYATGMSGVEFYHNPAHSSYGGYCYFSNEGNTFTLAGIWNTSDGLYVAKEMFLWQEGWPGAE